MSYQNNEIENVNAILERIFRNRGFDINDYSLSSIQRRINGRMTALGILKLDDYMYYIESNPSEYRSLFNAILDGESIFFRDPEIWNYLDESIIPKILQNSKKDIRIWSIGCASGEEAYSVAIIFREILKDDIDRYNIRIYATDIDESALEVARNGSYMADQLVGLSDLLRNKYFFFYNNLYVISSEIRNKVIFGKHNIVYDPIIANIDLLICRNVLIYLEPSLKPRVIQKLRYSLNNDGYLWLGRGETHIDNKIYGLKPIASKWRLFKKIPYQDYFAIPVDDYDSKYSESHLPECNDSDFLKKVRNANIGLVLADENYNVLLYNKTARNLCIYQYSEQMDTEDLAPIDSRLKSSMLMKPEALISFFDLSVSHYIIDIQNRIKEASINREFLIIDGIEHWISKNKRVFLRLQIIPLNIMNIINQGFLMIIEDMTGCYEINKRLRLTVESLRNANESLVSGNTILKSATDELEIINEYLQSKNSEELILINEKLSEQESELDALKLQYETLLNGVEFGVIVIDQSLIIKSINLVACDMLNLDFRFIKNRSLEILYHNEIFKELIDKSRETINTGNEMNCMIKKPNIENKKVSISITPINRKKSNGAILIIKEE